MLLHSLKPWMVTWKVPMCLICLLASVAGCDSMLNRDYSTKSVEALEKSKDVATQLALFDRCLGKEVNIPDSRFAISVPKILAPTGRITEQPTWLKEPKFNNQFEGSVTINGAEGLPEQRFMDVLVYSGTGDEAAFKGIKDGLLLALQGKFPPVAAEWKSEVMKSPFGGASGNWHHLGGAGTDNMYVTLPDRPPQSLELPVRWEAWLHQDGDKILCIIWRADQKLAADYPLAQMAPLSASTMKK